MEKKTRELRNHYIICGYGRVGHQVGQTFMPPKVPYIISTVKKIRWTNWPPENVPSIIGDATSDQTLIEAGIRESQRTHACSDSDMANVYITLSARALNPKLYIVAPQHQGHRKETYNRRQTG